MIFRTESYDISVGYPEIDLVQNNITKNICDSEDMFEETMIGIIIPFKINLEECLKWATQDNHLKILEYLIKQGADIHHDRDYALRICSKRGHLNTVKYLVAQGADIHAMKDFAYIWSTREMHFETTKYLVEQGANIHASCDWVFRHLEELKETEMLNWLIEKRTEQDVRGLYANVEKK